MSAAARAAAVARDLLLLRTRYPAIRAGPATRRGPVDALADLGFDRNVLERADGDYTETAGELFRMLHERARAAGADDSTLAKFARRDLREHEAMRLVYLAVRAARPKLVVETGTWAGFLSSVILLALEQSGDGRLMSFDLPAYEPIPHATEVPLPRGSEPGWIVPDHLRGRLELVVGDTRETLAPALAGATPLGVFLHDSLHTTRHMLFEYRHAWRALAPGGLLLSDDIFETPAFWLFARVRRLPFRHSGGMGALRKPFSA